MAILLGWTIAGERLTAMQVAGVVIVLGSVAVVVSATFRSGRVGLPYGPELD